MHLKLQGHVNQYEFINFNQPGLISRWITPFEWKYATAEKIACIITAVSSSLNHSLLLCFSLHREWSDPQFSNSITMKILVSDSITFSNFTIFSCCSELNISASLLKKSIWPGDTLFFYMTLTAWDVPLFKSTASITIPNEPLPSILIA